MSELALRLRREGEALAAPFPALLAEAQRVAATVALGVHGRRRPGMGESFWEYRHYQVGDAAHRVDWRRSARSEDLFIRESEWEAAQSVWLWRDGRASLDFASERGLPTKRDRASVLLIALAALLTRAGERVAVIGESAQPRAGRVGLDRVARRLAEGPGAPEALLTGAVGAQSRVVLASDFFEPVEVWAERLAALSGPGVRGALVQVVDPAEETFPYEGRVRFVAPGAGDALVVGRAQSLAEAYRARFAAHRAALADAARRMGWTFSVARTDKPASAALMALYGALAPQR